MSQCAGKWKKERVAEATLVLIAMRLLVRFGKLLHHVGVLGHAVGA